MLLQSTKPPGLPGRGCPVLLLGEARDRAASGLAGYLAPQCLHDSGSPCASTLPHKGQHCLQPGVCLETTWSQLPRSLRLHNTPSRGRDGLFQQISACVSLAHPGSWATAEPML